MPTDPGNKRKADAQLSGAGTSAGLLGRLVAKVTALLPEDWSGKAGIRFRHTVRSLAGDADVAELVREGTKRVAVGAVSHQHAEAVKNYAEEERTRAEAELARRTLQARVRQEDAKADQEETRARMMQSEELLRRLDVFDKLRALNALPVWDQNGNMHIVKAPAQFEWDQARERLFDCGEIVSMLDSGNTTEEPGE